MKCCETCENEHKGEYGSGRFCSVSCAKKFSTSVKRHDINRKISKTLLSHGVGRCVISCLYCDTTFIVRTTRKDIRKFCSRSCATAYKNLGRPKSEEVKHKIKEGVKRSYENGKEIYGGKSKWHTYKDIKVQGSYELRTCKILDRWKKEKKIKDWEYTNDRIKYVFNNKESFYLLDFKIIKNDGSFYYLETKGYQTEKDIAKWNQVKSLGLCLIVWFDADIKENE